MVDILKQASAETSSSSARRCSINPGRAPAAGAGRAARGPQVGTTRPRSRRRRRSRTRTAPSRRPAAVGAGFIITAGDASAFRSARRRRCRRDDVGPGAGEQQAGLGVSSRPTIGARGRTICVAAVGADPTTHQPPSSGLAHRGSRRGHLHSQAAAAAIRVTRMLFFGFVLSSSPTGDASAWGGGGASRWYPRR